MSIFRKLIYLIRTEGVFSVLIRIKRRLFRRFRGKGKLTELLKVDVLGFYDFVLTVDAGTLPTNINYKSKSISWFIPGFGIGSGGHINIFRFIYMLEHRGYSNTICITGSHGFTSETRAREFISKHFFPLKASVVFNPKDLPASRYCFASSWTTAYVLRGFDRTRHKLYFVQDFEPDFYPKGSEYCFAEETYKLGFTGICSGHWLSQRLKTKYDMKCYTIGFAVDHDMATQISIRSQGTNRVFCYCRPPTLRRGLETALLALNLVGNRLPEVEFVFAGWNMSGHYFPHKHHNAGVVPLKELPLLYNQCDVGLVLSFTNVSLVPLELMICGCVVVSNRGPNTEWLLNDSNSILVESTPKEISNAIVDVLKDEKLRTKLVDRAKVFALSTSWDTECDRLVKILQDIASTE